MDPDLFATAGRRLDPDDVRIVGQRGKGLICGRDFDVALAV
jgi:hypothetical protein